MIAPTSAEQITTMVGNAVTASRAWAATDEPTRAAALDAVADALDAAADTLVPVAMRETHLGEPRLRGELTRTSFQLRLLGEVVRDGGYLDARIDHADPAWPMGARPDIRRVLVPIGPVVVFAASNFPFAFSVIGGDSAAALAAGNAVVLKAHSGHPELSALTTEVVVDALASVEAPAHLLQMITGTEAGRAAIVDPRVQAGAFTGSIPGGRALFDLAQSRPEPIPFYGELGSLNPVFITEQAAAGRPEQIVEQFVASFTLGAGQFCTKPGLLLHPADSGIRALLAEASLPPAAQLLNPRIQSGFTQSLSELELQPGVAPLQRSTASTDNPPAPTLLATDIETVLTNAELLHEVFGPAALVVSYTDEQQLVELAERLPGQLTATLIADEDDRIAPPLIATLTRRAGRVLWNEWPTGVTVSYAQQHGGPYPATTASTTTSVGTAAITRFVRPVAYQNLPQALLPASLRDGAVPALVDGVRIG
ncbi:aldehyde dehydrogenase family protein [Pseudoclavibacter soli]|uniref:aldehyde dehydrogenase family protein n=1 Tax=Pseudoclavibacter soli TaxID=452623 RepID=UPI00040CBE08|nr:aldehyde dehydrogenase family protein [Pseudoclavibacter soli]